MGVAKQEESKVARDGFHLPLDLQQMNLKLPYVVLLKLHLSMGEVALAIDEYDDGVEDEEVMDASLLVEVVEEYVAAYDDEEGQDVEKDEANGVDGENDVQSLLLELD